jgi:aryl-alcohol dehydrogenase (NADP+)
MTIDYRPLGKSGLRVSPICLGTMMFGRETDAATSRRIIDKAAAQGVNFIDTADVYTGGESERIVGEAIRSNRDHWILATKVGQPAGEDPNERGASRKHILRSIDRSLRRLGADYVDVYYIHREDHLAPVAETVRTLGDLIRAGKIRYYGLSNHRAWKLAEFSRVADALGVDRPIVSQPLYNLANRQIEFEHLDAADHYGIGVVPYSPLARGVLTAKYEPGATPSKDTRAGRNDPRIMQTEWRPESLDLAQRVKDHVAPRGITPGQFAVAWVLNNRLVTSVIAGPRTEAQWDDYLPAAAYDFTAEDESFVNTLVPSGHSSTPGYSDPAYPSTGRRPRTG